MAHQPDRGSGVQCPPLQGRGVARVEGQGRLGTNSEPVSFAAPRSNERGPFDGRRVRRSQSIACWAALPASSTDRGPE